MYGETSCIHLQGTVTILQLGVPEGGISDLLCVLYKITMKNVTTLYIVFPIL
jgi:hypothetical protein